MTRPVHERALELMLKVEEAIPETGPAGPREFPRLDGLLLMPLWRVRSLHHAIHLLMVNGLLDEALVLWRSLFEDAVRLRSILREPDRAPYVISMLREAAHERRKLIEEGVRAELEADPVPLRQAVDDRLRELDKFQSDHGIKKPITPPSTKDGARNLGWKTEYWLFIAGPQTGVDYGKLTAAIPQISVLLEDIDKSLFRTAQLFCLLLVDRKPDSKGLLTHLMITTAQRKQLVKQIDSSFGARLSDQNRNYTVESAALMRDFLLGPRKSADEPRQ